MENNHLTYFKIENFKKFDSLEVNDIGQFNLIVGDNNVGKTCLLEALLVDEKNRVLSNANFLVSSINRGLISIDNLSNVNKYSHHTHLVKKGNEIKFQINENKFTLSFGNELIDFTKIQNHLKELIEGNQFKFEINYSFFKVFDEAFNYPLVSFLNKEHDIVELYNMLSTKKEKEDLIKTLKVILPLLEDIEHKTEFKQIANTFIFSFEDKNEFIPLNYLGDGFKRIFYIILKTISLKGKRIMIDEIEIGIHHSKMKDFWVNIINVCKELDVQLFATTHSQECTEAFVKASKIAECENDIRLIKLEESSNKEKIYASTFKYNQISAGLESNVELRG